MRATRFAAAGLALALLAASCGGGSADEQAAWCEANWRSVLEAFYEEYNGTVTMDDFTNGYMVWVDLGTGTTLPETSMGAYLQQSYPAEYAGACATAFASR